MTDSVSNLILPSGREIELKKLAPLCDVDSVVYSAGFSADAQVVKQYMENTGCDKDKATELAGDEDYLSYALANAKQMLQDNVKLFDKNKARFFLTGSGNYREEIATIAPYKGNRDSTHKPKYFRELREYIITQWNAEVIDGMEADDAVSIEQWKNRDLSTVIVGIDKDLRNCPGVHFNPRKGEVEFVSLADADKNFWFQVATGDSTDNIKGLHKIGIKTVEKEWEKHHDLEKLKDWIARMYDKQYRDEGPHAMHENATLCWIMREPWVNYDGSNLRGEA